MSLRSGSVSLDIRLAMFSSRLRTQSWSSKTSSSNSFLTCLRITIVSGTYDLMLPRVPAFLALASPATLANSATTSIVLYAYDFLKSLTLNTQCTAWENAFTTSD